MNSRDKLVSLAIAGGLLLAVGVWTTSWWTADIGMAAIKVGLHEVRVCSDFSPCVSVPLAAARSFADHEATQFLRYSNIAYVAGLIGGVLLFAHAGAIAKRDERRIGIAAAVACGICAVAVIATFVARPADAGGALSVGFSPFLACAGLALGMGSVVPSLIPDAIPVRMLAARDRLHRAALGPLADLENPPPRAELPTVRVVDGNAPLGSPPPASVAPAHAAVEHVAIRARRGGAGPSMDALRFVARECHIEEHGLVADGGREVSWQRIARVVMRQLPPDAPLDGQLVLDIVPASWRGERVTPLRLVPSTGVNSAALPGGAAPTARQNLEKLAELIRDRNPNSILDGAPPRFANARHFHDYDGQYG